MLIGALWLLVDTIKELLSLIKADRDPNSSYDYYVRFHNKPKGLCYQYELYFALGDRYISLYAKPTTYDFISGKRRSYFDCTYMNMRKNIKKILKMGEDRDRAKAKKLAEDAYEHFDNSANFK